MKKTNRVLAFLLAIAMLLGMAVPMTAQADTSNVPGETTVDIHKVLMPKDAFTNWQPKPHDGSQIADLADYFGAGAKAINGVAFRVYKVTDDKGPNSVPGNDDSLKPYGTFDSTKYYTLMKFGNPEKEFVLTQKVGTEDGIAQVTLPNGKYYIVEDKANSTYNETNMTGMKAVPFMLELPAPMPNGTKNYDTTDILHVYPKNTDDKVKFDKNFAQKHGLEAIKDPNTLKDVGAVVENYQKQKATLSARVGQPVPYESVAEMPTGTFFKQLHFNDLFEKGLKYVTGSMEVTWNVVTSNDKTKPATGNALTKGTDYTITETESGFDISFTETGLKKLNDAAKTADIQIWFSYNGEVTKEAIIDKPIDNNITMIFNHEKPTPVPVQPKGGKIDVTKSWADGGQAPKNVKVKYVLKEGDKVVGAVKLPVAGTTAIDLGDGIKFTPSAANSLSGTFSGLDDTKEYTVVEFVDGYTPQYTTAEVAPGKLTITNTKTPTSITPTPPSVETHGKRFVKTNDKTGNELKRLNNAQFIIKKDEGTANVQYLTLKKDATAANDKTAYDTAEKNYQDAIDRLNVLLGKTTLTTDEQTEKTKLEGADTVTGSIKQLKAARDKAYAKVNEVWDWTADKDAAYKFTSDAQGQFEVKGLRMLPSGKVYTVEEVKAPAGYVLPSNAATIATFTVGEGSYDTQKQGIEYKLDMTGVTNPTALQIENTLVTIPKTGGMGTALFIGGGIALMLGAGYVFLKNRKEEMAAE
ncbi:pilin N-terminal domain-containing protein [Murdochiella vaginalis]|uniref:pilin N-terminal domain-containing protein n=1 Tax=Murdochiella vaginalis TaxID=1852373 RepID=UPI0008FDF27E|nr:pilin N-terminal domain-containing protein [Murdochiella vaginalis]